MSLQLSGRASLEIRFSSSTLNCRQTHFVGSAALRLGLLFTPGNLAWVEVKTFKSVWNSHSSYRPVYCCGCGHSQAGASADPRENQLFGGEAAVLMISRYVEIR